MKTYATSCQRVCSYSRTFPKRTIKLQVRIARNTRRTVVELKATGNRLKHQLDLLQIADTEEQAHDIQKALETLETLHSHFLKILSTSLWIV